MSMTGISSTTVGVLLDSTMLLLVLLGALLLVWRGARVAVLM
jgi:hypothetical protein